MAADTGNGQAEEQGAAGLPAKVHAPAYPQCAAAQVRRRKQQAEDEGNGKAGSAGAGQKLLDQGVVGRKAESAAERTGSFDKSLKTVAAEGDLLGQRGEQKEKRVGRKPAPLRDAAR